MSPPELQPLRRPRRWLTFPRVAARFNPGIREVLGTVEPFAKAWDQQNRQELNAVGPLLVALGDSSAQGVGASRFDRGFVGLVHSRLRKSTGQPWRVLNLAMSGGRFSDVIDRQIPMLHRLGVSPDLVTCVVGSNDVIWRLRSAPVLEDAHHLVRSLPEQTLLSEVAFTRNNRRRRVEVNKILSNGASTAHLHTLQIWRWPAPEGSLAPDNFHPNDRGYQQMADLLWGALEQAALIGQESDHRPR
jgi:lysophospholipase L1-like esterase